MWRQRVCRPVTSILSTRSCRCRDPFRNTTTTCRTCRSRRNRRRCRPRRARRPKSHAATSRFTPTARTVSLVLTRPRTPRTMLPRKASGCRSWKLETSPGRRWTRVAPCWFFQTPGSLCRYPREPFPNRSGKNSIWRCSTRIVTGPDYPVSANYSWCYAPREADVELYDRSCKLSQCTFKIFAIARCYFYINAIPCTCFARVISCLIWCSI